MKIGIVTIQPTINYGGILQAYALQTVLECMGHEVEIICDAHRYFTLPLWKKPFVYIKRLFLKYLCGRRNLIIRMEEFRRDKACQYTEIFIQQNLNIHTYKSFEDIKENDYDAFVVGSDQIWREIYNRHIETSYLAFTEKWNVGRIAYAASFGTDDWEYNKRQTENCKRLIQLFDAVSVRENSGVELVRKYLDSEAEHVLDPTMLFTMDFYINIFKQAKVPGNVGDMLCYILDETPQVRQQIDYYKRTELLTPYFVNSHCDDDNYPACEWIQPPVENWLRGFYDAKLVITDSFHAIVFSIIFKKPFVVLGNEVRGNTRFASLLTLAGFDISMGIVNRLFRPTKQTAKTIEKHREKSIQFLMSGLGGDPHFCNGLWT